MVNEGVDPFIPHSAEGSSDESKFPCVDDLSNSLGPNTPESHDPLCCCVFFGII